MTNKTTAATITDQQIRALRTESTIANDAAMVQICTRALGRRGGRYTVGMSTDSARAECARVIANAQAQQYDATLSAHRNDHGGFCTWAYNGPSKRARGFWHGDNPVTAPVWAYALRSMDGTFWETSRAKGGFPDEAAAIRAASAALADRRVQTWTQEPKP